MYCVLRVIRLPNRMICGLGELKFSGPAFFLRLRIWRTADVALTALIASLTIVAPVFGQGWERLGPPGGMVTSLAAAADGTVYLGTPDGHIFASTDRGERWELRGRAGGRLDDVVQRIAPDSRDAKRLLAAVWFRNAPGGGVFESRDGAKTWRLAGLGEEAVRALEQSASEPSVWVAGTRSGVFRSGDDTKTWQRIMRADDAELQNVDSLAIDPRDARTLYVGTYHLPWKTTDGGETWSSISRGMIDDSDIMSLRIDAKDPRGIFSSACSGIYRSEDGGASWTKLQGIPYSSRRTQQIVQDPAESRTLYAATTEGLWMTPDYGETWKRITARDTDVNGVVVLGLGKEKTVLAGTSAQGILRSVDGGDSFAVSNAGFSHRVIAALAVSAQDRRQLLARVEGYGDKLLVSDDAGRNWREVGGKSPPKPVAQIFSSAQGWWASFAGGGLGRFDSNARVWRPALFRETIAAPKKRTGTGRRTAVRTVVPDVNALVENGGKLLLATDTGLWEPVGGGMEFHRVAAKGLPQAVSYLSVTTAGGLLAIADGELWSQQASGEWKHVANAPRNAARLLWFEENSSQPKSWLVGTQSGVFVGRAGEEWVLVANGLPATASVAPAFVGSKCLMAMGNGGLYESTDGMKTWVRLDGDGERGRVGQAISSAWGFVVGSEQEGILLRAETASQ